MASDSPSRPKSAAVVEEEVGRDSVECDVKEIQIVSQAEPDVIGRTIRLSLTYKKRTGWPHDDSAAANRYAHSYQVGADRCGRTHRDYRPQGVGVGAAGAGA